MIGDDLGDLAGFAASGVGVAVADAVEPVRVAADLICDTAGGHGAVRELAEVIVAARAETQ
jgi:3-deoxy-D-manno-octulosonate 8-phosphate phosphatase KdsC-like HAD superfamily phosphatase